MKLYFAFTALALICSTANAADYFPPAGKWQQKPAAELQVDAKLLQQAVDYAIAAENKADPDQAINQATTFGAKEPYDQIIGPMQTRSPANGMVIYKGSVVAQWGNTDAVDMTHSITKTFLTTLTGLAWQQGLIHDLQDKVGPYMPQGTDFYQGEHNSQIRWDHLLRQTSDWQGTLWGKPDWADRPESKVPAEWPHRPLRTPGTFYKYNDVRVNLLALSTLYVWRKPLPQVLNEQIMQPIGASSTWRWYGYDNSWIELDGQKIQSVSGGGHWGGGMFINAWDLARFGYLFLRDGKWQDKQLVSQKWIELARTPGPDNAEYGFANWFLNPGRKALPAAPASAVTFQGAGRNIIYIDKENDLLIVARWIGNGDELNQLVGKVLQSLPSSKTK